MFNFLIFFTLFFMFLQDSVFTIGKQVIFISIVVLWLLLLFTSIKYFKNLFNTAVYAIRKTPVKYLLLFVFFILLFGVFTNSFNIGVKVLFRIILIWGLVVLPTTIFSMFYFPKKFSYNKLLSFFITAYNLILFYGIFNFLVRITNIKPFLILHNFLCPRGILVQGGNLLTAANTLERATSIFFEPSFYGTFLFLFIPIPYLLYTSHIKLGKTQLQDKVIKLGMIALTWVNLLLTMSPMYILICVIYTVIFFKKWIFNIKPIKMLFFLVLFILFSLFFLNVQNNSFIKNNKVCSRIYNTVTNLKNSEQFIEAEPSLGTRVLTSINTYQATKKHPFIGVGYGNSHNIMYKQYLTTNTPLTWEITLRAIIEDNASASSNIFWGLWLQTGIIGIIILYTYFGLSIYYSLQIRKYYTYTEQLFLSILILIAINYIIISFYWSLETYPMMWFIFGLLNSYILTYKLQVKRYYLRLEQNMLKEDK